MWSFLVISLVTACTLAIAPASAAQERVGDKTGQSRVEQPGDSPEEMQKLLVETARTYREAKSFRIERKILETIQSELTALSDTTLMSVVAAPGNRYRSEIKYGSGWNIRQSDGRTEWEWYPWRKEYVERPAGSSPDPEGGVNPAESGFVGFLREIDKKLANGRVQAPQTIDVGYGPVRCLVIVGPPPARRPDPTMHEQTTYWVDKERKVLVREENQMSSTVPEHRYEGRRTITYTTEINISIPDSVFKFVPPNDARQVAEIETGRVELAGKAAPPLKLKSLDGKDFDLASLRGQAVLVDFWATWCMPCRESMPMLAKLYEEFKGKGLAVVSVSKDEYPPDAARFIAKYKYAWLQVADPKGETEATWGSFGIPHLVLIGKDGKVLLVSDGFDEKEGTKIRSALENM